MVELRERLRRAEPYVVIALAVIYFALYSVLSVVRHLTYHSFGPDLGIFDQVFWNTTQGRFLESTMSLAQPVPHSYLADHFSPVYLLLLPAYAIVPRPETLVVIQTLFLALGVWPIYLLARLKLPPGFPRLVWVFAYFLFLPLAFINLFDFHELALSVLPLGFALYFLERRQTGLFIVSLLATFLIKEELPLIGIGFGASILLGKPDWNLRAALLVASLPGFFEISQLRIPVFSGYSAACFQATIRLRYGVLGARPGRRRTDEPTAPAKMSLPHL